ncbi:MAG: restriction endonuclease subunit S [Anaerococcus vaginalis]|nr:restriction endonuclease subunit S [Anaerococcus vaginalis]
MYNIEDITKIKNGKDWKKLNSGDIPVYGSGGYMNVSVDKYVYNKPTVLIPRKGSIENIFYLDKPFWNVDTIFYTEIDETKIIPKYFYYFMKTLDLKSLSTNSTRPSLTQTVLNKVKIKLPSLEIQNKVVEVLDRFQDLISNAEGLLPVEIEQRQKQYEYYREKLLTFENNMVQVKSSQVK